MPPRPLAVSLVRLSRGPEALGPAEPYPSLAVDAAGTLHLAHRERADRWQLWYRRKRPGSSWEAPRPLAVSPEPGYNHYMQSLSVGPTGTIHLTFQFHYAASGRAEDCRGRAAVYLYSEDGGDTWINDDGTRCSALPLTIETARSLCRYPEGGVRIGNHVVDGENRPLLFASLPNRSGGVLWRRDVGGWKTIDLSPALGDLCTRGGRATSLSRDVSGGLHLVAAVDPDGRETAWFDPSLELFHICLDADGTALGVDQMTEADPVVAHWLPALEQWNWSRREQYCRDGIWLLYTRGLNAGGIWGDNRNAIATEIHLSRL